MQFTQAIMYQMKKAVVGKDDVIARVVMAVLAGGHILLEDIPGVGKTTLALSLSRAARMECRRMQFTPDVMPSDVTGFSIPDRETGELRFQPGPVLCNLFLADEINRASAKTQSSLLEVMEERQVTVDGVTHQTPLPFTVIATQNPAGSAGTQLLPESQLDRFMVRLTMGYPSEKDEIEILKRRRNGDPLAQVDGVASAEDIIAMQGAVRNVFVKDEVYDYIVRLASATRQDPDVRLGASPRASVALLKMSQAAAFLQGRDYVTPEDVQTILVDVMSHRIILTQKARVGGLTAIAYLENLLGRVAAPGPN